MMLNMTGKSLNIKKKSDFFVDIQTFFPYYYKPLEPIILAKKFSVPSAGVAQLVEQLICNQQVVGSIPIASSVMVFWRGSRAAKGNRL